ncbi:MAG: aminotransferase class I/II-fold pyridoxal phosphate-dependent enzyme, partial [Candidatus Bathyarchaeia archaeon]
LVTPQTKMIILNSPHNPCGSMLTKRDIEEIAEIVKKHNLFVLSDEIYDKITYEQKHYSIASEADMKDHTIIINGFSKTYAMTGWRLGYAVANKSIISQMARLHLNISSCAAAFVQMAGIAALRGPQDCVKEMLQEYARRREIIVEGLNSIRGISCKKPSGAFYVFPNIKKLGMGSREFAQYLLTNGGVAALHGTAFGKFGEGYLRLSYATSITNIKKGLEKIKIAVEKLNST